MACIKVVHYLYNWTLIPNPHWSALWILLPKSRRLLKYILRKNCTRKKKENFKNRRKAPTIHLDHHTAAANMSVTARPLIGAG